MPTTIRWSLLTGAARWFNGHGSHNTLFYGRTPQSRCVPFCLAPGKRNADHIAYSVPPVVHRCGLHWNVLIHLKDRIPLDCRTKDHHHERLITQGFDLIIVEPEPTFDYKPSTVKFVLISEVARVHTVKSKNLSSCWQTKFSWAPTDFSDLRQRYLDRSLFNEGFAYSLR